MNVSTVSNESLGYQEILENDPSTGLSAIKLPRHFYTTDEILRFGGICEAMNRKSGESMGRFNFYSEHGEIITDRKKLVGKSVVRMPIIYAQVLVDSVNAEGLKNFFSDSSDQILGNQSAASNDDNYLGETVNQTMEKTDMVLKIVK